jgi:hypothetical protein
MDRSRACGHRFGERVLAAGWSARRQASGADLISSGGPLSCAGVAGRDVLSGCAVLHAVTVHWQDDRWIGPQLRNLRRHLPRPHRVYASLNGIDPLWSDQFHYASDLPGTHAEKLNELARTAKNYGEARDDDLLLFIDGDAFPIAPVRSSLLDGKNLAAVRRDENGLDPQPHPCFCLTTVGFWFEIEGDWRPGYSWTNAAGLPVTDVGGNLLGQVTERGIPWTPLLRTNRVDLDPLWFGIYGDVVYHHGAGFRAAKSRASAPSGQDVAWASAQARVPASVPVIGRLERSARFRIARYRQQRAQARAVLETRDISDEVFRAIETDDEFYRRFV